MEPSLRLVAPVHERKRDGDGEEQAADHRQNLLHLVFVVLRDLLALDVRVPYTHTHPRLTASISKQAALEAATICSRPLQVDL